ncbi:MAG: hypoxanthine phosphoribosyltransferase [Acidobacteria bacterium]|nr:hypoxanthine phosphoribosyltransferase [Acidobacteriota bacterium]MCG3193240.1 Hypoxanthine-guanine phosphoribosyltransferase [Thermoanaerobaculia bacterium]MCK6685260.1 hypoxanthine phosphoribosyltransferase [Thermoanaerobaculia bacterium]
MIERTLLSETEIGTRLDELAKEIDERYAGQEILAVGILKGSVFFLTDLLKRLKTPVAVDFLQVRSYSGTSSTGNIQMVHDLSTDIEGRHVLLFEDVVDTGLTLRKILELFSSRHPASLRIAALLKKDIPENRDLSLDFVGFTIGPEFVIGYGLDLDEKYRNLPYVAVWRPEK